VRWTDGHAALPAFARVLRIELVGQHRYLADVSREAMSLAG
jgi:hypothetical protein